MKKSQNQLTPTSVIFVRHRKKYHEQIVPICNKFESGECLFGGEKCWFNHKTDSEDTNDKKIKDGKFENVKVSKKLQK